MIGNIQKCWSNNQLDHTKHICAYIYPRADSLRATRADQNGKRTHRRRRRNGLVFYLTPHLKLREDCSLVSTFPWQQYHTLPRNCFSHHTRCIIFKSACVRLFPLQKSFETFHNHHDERHAGMRDSLLQILSKIEQLKVFACHETDLLAHTSRCSH